MKRALGVLEIQRHRPFIDTTDRTEYLAPAVGEEPKTPFLNPRDTQLDPQLVAGKTLDILNMIKTKNYGSGIYPTHTQCTQRTRQTSSPGRGPRRRSE